MLDSTKKRYPTSKGKGEIPARLCYTPETYYCKSTILHDHYIYYCGQESLRRNGVAIMVNKRVQSAVLGCNLKDDRIISVRFQGKPFNITVIQVYAPTSKAEEAEVERFYGRPIRPFTTNTQKRCPFHYRGLECKSRKLRNTWGIRQICPWNME